MPFEGVMPRNRPASLRLRERTWRRPWVRYRSTPGLSGATNAAIRQLEGARLMPGVVAAAINVWSVHVRGIRRPWKQWEAEFTCSCCGAGWARDMLEDVMTMLPPRAGSEVRSSLMPWTPSCCAEAFTIRRRRPNYRGGTADADQPNDRPWCRPTPAGGGALRSEIKRVASTVVKPRSAVIQARSLSPSLVSWVAASWYARPRAGGLGLDRRRRGGRRRPGRGGAGRTGCR